MSLSPHKLPLGAVLLQAGLVSGDNVKQALQKQRNDGIKLRIGEILVSQGCINSRTADFFAEEWFDVIQTKSKQPLGQYLKQAALLSDSQIQAILNEQKQSKLRFGELAIAKGWLQQTTVDFFLRYLAPELFLVKSKPKTAIEQPNFNSVKSDQQVHEKFYKIKLKLLNLEDREAYSEKVLDKVLLWTGGQSFLTQKLVKLVGEHRTKVIPGKESEQIDRLVQTKLLKDWRQQELGEHLQNIESRLLDNQRSEPNKLLRLYRQALTTVVPVDNTKEQQELLKIGLVIKQQEQLVVANRIYQLVFNPSWIQSKLNELSHQPNSKIAVYAPSATLDESIPPKKPPLQERKSFQFKNLLLLLALLGLLLVFINNLTRRIKVRTAFKKGNEHLKDKSFEKAIAEYNTLLNIDSNYFQAWTNRGYALAGLEQYNEMRESCSTATIIDPTAVYAWNCQGEALHNLQREEEAILAFDKAIALNKNDPIFLINKSESLKSIGNNEQSLVTIEKAIQILERVEAIKGKAAVSGEFAVALTFLGHGYRQKGQYESALNNYERALEYSPKYFSAQIGRGIVLNQIQRYQEAQEEFERILTDRQLSEARKAQVWFYLGQTLCNSQQNSASVAAFERAIQLRPNYQAAQQAKQQCR